MILDPANPSSPQAPISFPLDSRFVAAALDLRGCGVPRVALFYDGKFDLSPNPKPRLESGAFSFLRPTR
jgi:hypothetical protein